MDELQDEMLDMKMQTDLMNQMLNRNYDMDYDEEEFEDEFMEFEKEVATEKKKAIAQPIKKPQQQQNSMDIDSFLKWFFMLCLIWKLLWGQIEMVGYNK